MIVRRPLLYVAAGYSAAVFIAYYSGIMCAAIWSAVVIVICLFLLKGSRAGAIFCVSFIVGAAAFAYCDMAHDPLYDKASADPGAYAQISGKVIRTENKESAAGDPYLQLTVSTGERSGIMKRKSRVLVRYYGEDCPMIDAVPGSRINASGSLDLPEIRRNPGCFDQMLYLRTLGIRTVMKADSIVMDENCETGMIDRLYSSLNGRLYVFRKDFIERLASDTDKETAGMMQAILFGDKEDLDEETLEDFQKNGTAHILAVSGLHIGMIYAFLLKIHSIIGGLFGLGRRGWGFFCFTGFFFFCYMILASFSPSVVRAVFMVLLHAFASMTGRRYDLSSAAFFIYVLVLLRNPYMLFNVGFEMSFLAVLSMSLVLPYISRIYSGVFMASLAVQIGLGPFILYHFNTISLLSVFINVPVIMMTGVLVPCGLCCALVPYLAAPVDIMCKILRYFNGFTAADGVTTFTIASPDVRLIFLYYLLILCLASEAGRLRIMRADDRRKYIAKALAFVIAVTVISGNMCDDGFRKADITFVDVGQGDCMCIRNRESPVNENVYLIDGGGNVRFDLGKKTLRQYLLKNGMDHVDIAFVTHLHTDHYLGICQLAKEGMVRHLCVYDGNRLREERICEETGLSPARITYLSAGQKLDMANDLTIEVLWPLQRTDAEYSRLLSDETNENDMSLLFKVTCDGVSMLATGDMDEEGEKAVIATLPANDNELNADILKVGHHGSKTSTSDILLDYVNPKIAVIQVGKNNMYGHPTPETLQKLEDRNIPVYRNDLSGAIGVQISGGEIRSIAEMQ